MNDGRSVRERVEEIERASLSTWAILAAETKGRDRYEEPDPLRTVFQQDRERILWTSALARLEGKAHRFVPAEPRAPQRGWRSQMAHTRAAVELARSLARGLRLNEDLAEAIASGHALGAPPFGVAGAEALAGLAGATFDVGEQGLRIVERLAARGRGLNLTWEVRDGILHHARPGAASTVEGQAVALAVRLAVALHGLTDALVSDLVRLDDVPHLVRTRLGTAHRERLSAVVVDAVDVSTDRPEVVLSPDVEAAVAELEGFLATAVDRREAAWREADRARHCLESLAIYRRSGAAGAAARLDEAELLDGLAALTDAEASAAFVSAFRPDGGPLG